MLKKAGFITASAAALMMLGGTAAMATEGGSPHHGWPGTSNEQSQDILSDIHVLENFNLCGNQVNVIAVPVLNVVGADCTAVNIDD